MDRPALLDTHILVWAANADRRLSKAVSRVVAQATAERPLLISDISLWEIALLHETGRIKLALPLRDWLEQAVGSPAVRRCGIGPAVAATVAELPPTFHRDPADRILVATALVHGAVLLTADERIIDSGLVPTLS